MRVLWYSGAGYFQKLLPKFFDLAGDRVRKIDRELLERILASFPFVDLRGNDRLASRKNLTLIHADAKYDNILLPRDLSKDSVYLIDWAFWEVRLGTDDIAKIASYGFSDPEVGLTLDLVRRYYDGLTEHGVNEYGWDDCWHDYRLSTIRHVIAPVNDAIFGTSMDYCLAILDRMIRSFHALDCEELLVS